MELCAADYELRHKRALLAYEDDLDASPRKTYSPLVRCLFTLILQFR
jgi:hypothetical protein